MCKQKNKSLFFYKIYTFTVLVLAWKNSHEEPNNFHKSWDKETNQKNLHSLRARRLLMGKEDLEHQQRYSSLKEKISKLVNEDNDEFDRRINESFQDNKFKDQFSELLHASESFGDMYNSLEFGDYFKKKLSELEYNDNSEMRNNMKRRNFHKILKVNSIVQDNQKLKKNKLLKKTDSYNLSEMSNYSKANISNDYDPLEHKIKRSKFVQFMGRHKTLPPVLVILFGSTIPLMATATATVAAAAAASAGIITSLGALMGIYHLFNKKKYSKKKTALNVNNSYKKCLQY
ncbi:hypothetical protein MKS88_001551 [Plasmodium brasilianum]|uniref:Uncharacterized protein n=1 Tax=Plasmodium brasilianum TaxID=5824 RepID=A0ACB9YES3_PLABR|nr:hypothetical protein MKS88_001551 [Plasmodium brasilianum]